jgi:hypothetical protein
MKKTGSASAATVIAMHGFKMEVLAAASGVNCDAEVIIRVTYDLPRAFTETGFGVDEDQAAAVAYAALKSAFSAASIMPVAPPERKPYNRCTTKATFLDYQFTGSYKSVKTDVSGGELNKMTMGPGTITITNRYTFTPTVWPK